MSARNFLLAVGVTFSSVALAGCPGDSARAQKWEGPPAPLSHAEDAHLLPARKVHPHAPRYESSREAFLARYSDPEDGITFRYPRNYLLEEGEIQEHSYFLKSQQQLDLDEPGAELIATVMIPEDAYPNTTFEHGSLQLVQREDTNGMGCAIEDAGADVQRGRLNTSGGLRFDWTEEINTVGGTQVRERRYAGFSDGRCYEFFLTIAAGETADPEGFSKPADTAKIVKQLEKIISTFQLRAGAND